jgi:tetratricopeptide (TPR) repeat protein
VATAHNNLGDMLNELGRFDAAEQHFRAALQIRTTALGTDHARTITTLNNIASLHENRGDLATAESLRRDVLDRYREAYGPEHPRVALALSNLGSLLRKRGAYAEADSMLTQALDLQRRLLDPMHDNVGRTLEAQAALHIDREAWSRAEPLLREALAIRRETTPDHWETARAATQLGDVLMQLNRFVAAESLLISGVANLRAARGPDDDVTVAAESTLTVLYDAWGRPERQTRVLDSLQTATEPEN